MIEDGRFAPTEEGTPQGGVISPLIFSIALHGMEEAAGAAYRWDPYREAESAVPGTPVLVRYADDLVALCDSREQAEQAKARLEPWLAARGLAFNEEKTRVVHLGEGFDFLGFNVRRYGQKLLIKPSAGAVRRIRKRLADEVRALRGANATAVIRAIAPIVRGGPPTTGEWCPRRRSTSWITTCGSCSTSGRSTATTTGRGTRS